MFCFKNSSRHNSKTLATPSRLATTGNAVSFDLTIAKASELPLGNIQELPETEIIGKGRFAVCKKVLLQGTPVCAKAFLSSNAHTKLAVLREASILYKIRHPRIVCVLGVQTVQEPFQLVMVNYSVDGVSLTIYDMFVSTMLTGTKAATRNMVKPSLNLKAWLVMNEIASALEFIHSKSIVHRDLKSDNVVLNKQGEQIQCVLVNFGKSCFTTTAQKYNLSDQEKLEYRHNHKQIAPDLINGICAVSTASDMYSYGRLLKNILSVLIHLARH